MRGDRLFAILYLLAERGSMTAGQLAEQLEVSVRTIYRDIEALSVWGAPIRTEAGPGGGVSLMEGGALDKALLTAQQQRQVLMALENFSVAGGGGEQTLARLRAFFGQSEQSWIEADFSSWGGGRDQGQFALLRQAVLERREISFDYLDRQGKASPRRARPAKLIFKTSAWYVQAFCLSRQAWRSFKARRMHNLTLEEERFPPLSPPPLEPPPQAFPLVKLWFAPEHESRVREEFEPEQIKPLPSGGFLVQAPLPADDWLAGYLLSFGGGLRALDPPCLELRMRQKAERILADFCDSEKFSEITDIQLSAERAYDKGNKGDKRQKGE
ncbi:MAG: YafY family transcriptional regulator [Clostridiaceae bacterium]|jgi:predicted DNA-binding transcriptional regulator YafY|nr:YafY family transcriptional regulator [Clostridiaceae bacterium]